MNTDKFDIMKFAGIGKSEIEIPDDINIKDIKLNDKDYLNNKFGIKKYLFCNILDSIDTINFALSSNIDSKIIKSAIYMNIMRVDEEFCKLKDSCEFEVLQKFDSEDLKDIKKARTFIEFDYEKIDEKITKKIVYEIFPKIRDIIHNID